MNQSNPILLIVICITMLVSNNLSAQISPTTIDSLVQKAIDKFQVAGVAVAIVKDGKVIHKKGYGVQSMKTKQPVDIHTNFQIASCSKSFTTAALALLIDEGKLSWKDKVISHLPEFKMYDGYVTEHFLVEDLLCHRSGLGANAGDLMTFPDGSDFTIKEVLTNLQYLKPVSPFRTQFDYDNQLYIVAGELIARVSGMSWEKFVQTRILDALQMNQSFSALNAVKDSSNLAMPHSVESGDTKLIPFFTNQLTNPAGGIISNADDMSKWMIMQLNQGKYGNPEKQLFSQERQHEMWRMHTVIDGSPFPPSFNNHFFGYGLGWNLADIKGNLMAAHSGGIDGMTTELALIPDINLGILVLTNTDGAAGAATVRAIEITLLDYYLGFGKMDWVTMMGRMVQFQDDADTATKKAWETATKSEKIKFNKQNYVGIYEDKWFGKVEVSFKGDQLWFRSYRSPKLNGAMKFYKANTFVIKWEEFHDNADAFALFNLDEDGLAQSIQLKDIATLEGSHFQDLDFRRIKN